MNHNNLYRRSNRPWRGHTGRTRERNCASGAKNKTLVDEFNGVPADFAAHVCCPACLGPRSYGLSTSAQQY